MHEGPSKNQMQAVTPACLQSLTFVSALVTMRTFPVSGPPVSSSRRCGTTDSATTGSSEARLLVPALGSLLLSCWYMDAEAGLARVWKLSPPLLLLLAPGRPCVTAASTDVEEVVALLEESEVLVVLLGGGCCS